MFKRYLIRLLTYLFKKYVINKCKRLFDKLTDKYYTIKANKLSFKTIIYMIKTDIDLVRFVNKNRIFFHWDYAYMYDLMVWKMERMKETLKSENIISDVDEICAQIDEAIHYWDVYNNPEKEVVEPQWLKEERKQINNSTTVDNLIDKLHPERTSEQWKESSEYYTKLYEVEQDAWNKFHEILKNHAQRWWS